MRSFKTILASTAICACMLFSSSLYAQVPQSIQYQTVISDGDSVLANRILDIYFLFLDGNMTIYEERHEDVVTNDWGLLSLKIGMGTVISGSFAGLDWTNESYQLKIRVDDGNSLVEMTPNLNFSSVPYSLVAKRADNADSIASIGQIKDVNLSALDIGKVLKWDGSTWIPSIDNTSDTVQAVNTEIRISGDGTSSNPLDLAQQNASNNQVLKWNGSNWVPSNDEVDDGDSDPNNEFQTLNLTGNTLSLSNSTTTVDLPSSPTYTEGTGIQIDNTNFVITNTGDANPNDDMLIGSAAGGDLSNTYPDPTVSAIQGNSISPATPSSGQVLKWNGSTWIPDNDDVNDGDSNPSNEIQVLNLNGNNLSLSNGGGSVTIPGGITYTGGNGIQVNGTVISNTGDTNAGDDITTGSSAGGDVGGVFTNLSVNKIRGRTVSNSNPSNGDVLKWNGNSWTPDDDDTGTVATTDQISGDGSINNPLTLGFSNAVIGDGLRYVGGAWGLYAIPWEDRSNQNISYAKTGNVGIGTNFPSFKLDIVGDFALRNTSNNNLLVKIEKANTGEGIIETRGPNGTRNVVMTNLGSFPNNGYIGVNDDQGVTQARILVDSNGKGEVRAAKIKVPGTTNFLIEMKEGGFGEGVLETNGPNGNRNVVMTQPGTTQASANRGFIGVSDQNGNTQAQMFVNDNGEGELTADIIIGNSLNITGPKNFRMQHPEFPDKEIWYACIEGGEVAVYARGTARLLNGKAEITFPDHFELVSERKSMTVILTPLSGNSKGLAAVEKDLTGVIVQELFQGTGNYEFDWEVKAIRKGYTDYEVVRNKREE